MSNYWTEFFGCIIDIYYFIVSIVCSEIERRMQVKKLQRGLLNHEKVHAFSLFLESGAISCCLYGESGTILEKTYGMCILQVRSLLIHNTCVSTRINLLHICGVTEFLFQWIQDIEALTPNILARTIETVVWWCCFFVRFLLQGVYVPQLWLVTTVMVRY